MTVKGNKSYITKPKKKGEGEKEQRTLHIKGGGKGRCGQGMSKERKLLLCVKTRMMAAG